MSVRIRNSVDLCFAAAAVLMAFVSDAFLFSVFKSHVKQALLAPSYRPVYLRSGRRNRVR
jgi:hypothetical protein